MDNQESWIVLGRFGRPHGVKGFVTVHSFTEPRDNILNYENWHAFINHKWQPIKIVHAEVQNKYIIAKIEGYPERECVAQLTNIEIAVLKEQLEQLDPGEYYWHQIIGMKVVNPQGEVFGKVSDIIPTGANDVLVVEDTKRYLIPYLPGKFILDIDTNKQLITVDWDLDF